MSIEIFISSLPGKHMLNKSTQNKQTSNEKNLNTKYCYEKYALKINFMFTICKIYKKCNGIKYVEVIQGRHT